LDGSWRPDLLVLDDQALIVNVRGKGLVVMTGCRHAGVGNISRYATRPAAGQPLLGLIGGFHLDGPLFEPLIPGFWTISPPLRRPRSSPAHCTGWHAQHAMAARFGEGYLPNAVGTRFMF
jgi:7,8-dihydropterin-6-yl-methyl-4-(beta-D-ribofuranosyl)aminobenzene 5'-phosphate synthase